MYAQRGLRAALPPARQVQLDLAADAGAASSVQVGDGMGPVALARFALALSGFLGSKPKTISQ